MKKANPDFDWEILQFIVKVTEPLISYFLQDK